MAEKRKRWDETDWHIAILYVCAVVIFASACAQLVIAYVYTH